MVSQCFPQFPVHIPTMHQEEKKVSNVNTQKLLDTDSGSTFHCDPTEIGRGLWKPTVINGVWVLFSLTIGIEGLLPHPCGYFLRDCIVGKDVILKNQKNTFTGSLT